MGPHDVLHPHDLVFARPAVAGDRVQDVLDASLAEERRIFIDRWRSLATQVAAV